MQEKLKEARITNDELEGALETLHKEVQDLERGMAAEVLELEAKLLEAEARADRADSLQTRLDQAEKVAQGYLESDLRAALLDVRLGAGLTKLSSARAAQAELSTQLGVAQQKLQEYEVPSLSVRISPLW